MNNNTSIILGLKDVIVKKVVSNEDSIHLDIELPRRAQCCPECGTETNRIHDYRFHVIKDCPSFNKRVYLNLRKRRYVCPECGKRFYEANNFLPRYYRMTSRKIARIIESFHDTVSATYIARKNDVSTTTALRYFSLVSYTCKELPEVLSIDEFKGNAGGEKYQTIITDANNRKVLDILRNRKKSDLITHFRSFNNRKNVKFVVIDMNSHFKDVALTCFPDSTIIIIDRYHVTRQAIWGLERVRKTEQKTLSPAWRKQCKNSRYLLNKHPEDLTDEERARLRIILGLSSRLEKAYYLKNEFLHLMHSPDSQTAKELMAKWVYVAENSNLPEFYDCTRALHNWSPFILKAFDYPYTNGFTEGCNNKTKVLKRVCYGVSNFDRFRNRILYCAS